MKSGTVIVLITTAGMIFWTPNLSLWIVVVTLIFTGVGMGFTQSPAAAKVTLTVDKEELGLALGIFNMLRFVSATLGATICGVILEAVPFHDSGPLMAYRLCFIILAAIAAIAVLLAMFFPRSRSD